MIMMGIDRFDAADLTGLLLQLACLHCALHSKVSIVFAWIGTTPILGTALMRELLDAADNWLGFKRLELTVFTDNAPAIRLYEKFIVALHFLGEESGVL